MRLFGFKMHAKVITRCSIANLIDFSSFLSVVVFQNVKLGFAKTLKKQKLVSANIQNKTMYDWFPGKEQKT